MSKAIVYVHRLGSWYSLYMNDDNETRLRSFADVVSGGTREEPIPADELIKSMQGATGILSLNGIGAPEITTEVLREVGTVEVAVVSHWWHSFHEKAKVMWETAGVKVIDASDASTEAVAEWTIAAILMGVRRLAEFDRALRAGSPWGERRREAGLLCESVVGLIGLGRIGQRVARLLRPFGATVIGYDPFVSARMAQELGVRLVSLQELMRTADVISFHLPVNDETQGMFGAKELSWIRDGAVVINSARNALFNDADFVAEVQKKRFTAFLDVFEVEPLPIDHPYRSLENVFTTPHIAGDNRTMFIRCGRTAIEALRNHLAV